MKKRHKTRSGNLVPFCIPGDLTERFVNGINSLQPSVKADYLKKEFMTKYVSADTDSPVTRRDRAIFKWLCSERDNEATNERLLWTSLYCEDYNILPRVTYKRFIGFCSSLIARTIGELPPRDALIGSFSGGASTSRPRTASHPAAKYVGKAHVTPAATGLWLDLIQNEMPIWLRDGTLFYEEQFPGNVLFTVPKKSDIDRVAAKEPDLNMFIQKGVGAHFRKCLRRNKINLNDQGINRSLAREGALTGKLATLDLASASDSVTRELVFQLLPVTWFTLLDSIRSQVTVIDGVEHRNEMFSSMGNGFTFELESLIFWAIVKAVAYFRGVSGPLSVYGDDIICSADIAEDVSFALNYLGFQVNPDKSFISGPIRESCGGHYYDGLDITPFYLRKPLTEVVDVIDAANKLREWADHSPNYKVLTPYDYTAVRPYKGEHNHRTNTPVVAVLDPEVESLWLTLKGSVPRDLWGGVDTSFKYQLVSLDTPRSRLSEVTKSRSTGLGGYLHWHNAAWRREQACEAVETSRFTSSSGRIRVRPARVSTVNRLRSLFLHEIEKTSGL